MNKNLEFKKQEGFVALISVIIIFIILLILATLIATSSFFTRFNVLDYENKKVSNSLAEACATTAMVNIAKEPSSYPGSIPVGGQQVTLETGKTCRICSITTSPYTIKTRASYKGAYTNLIVSGTLSSTNFQVASWDETQNYSGATCVLP